MDGSGQFIGVSDWAAHAATASIEALPLAASFDLAGVTLVPDTSGALYIPSERMLVVADLHFEKGSALARRRNLLPPYDTAATLARLALVLPRFRPRRVVALGDSFHDEGGSERLQPADRSALRALQADREWIWVSGNHDRAAPRDCGGEAAAHVHVGGLVLRHLPSSEGRGEVAGHLHPAVRVRGRAGSVRRRCFVADQQRCVMPAFGAYAGGLNVHDRAIAGLFEGRGGMTAWVLGRHRVHAVSARQCLPER